MKIRLVESRLTATTVCEVDGRAYGKPAQSSDKAAALLGFLADRASETFAVLLLNGQNRTIGIAEVSVGTLTTSLVHPREVFGPALRMGAAGIIVAHNHPSGDPTPSREDLEVTRRLREAGALLGVPVLDHLIIGDGAYASLRERGCFND